MRAPSYLEGRYRNPYNQPPTTLTRVCLWIIVVILAIGVFYLAWAAIRHEVKPNIPPETKKEIISKLRNHKPMPLPTSTLVEINLATGEYRYQWDGRWYELK